MEERLTKLEVKVAGLENLVNALVNSRALDKMYTDADINGTRQSVANITPTVMTQTAYIQDTEVVFVNVPQGSLTISCDADYTFSRIYDTVVVTFTEPLEKVIEVTISIL